MRIHLAAEVGDVGLDDARIAVEVVFPHVVEDLGLAEHPVGVEHQVAQQFELGGAELDSGVADEDFVGVLVHRQLARADDGVFVGLHRAPQDRLDTGDDLVEAEGLGDVVVAADGQAGDLVFGVVLRREEQDGGRIAGAAEALGDAESVHVGKHYVEDDEVRFLFEDRGDGLRTVADSAHGETGEAEAGGEEIADVGLVVDDENAWSCVHGI